MERIPVYNSKSTRYKEPFGAVSRGSSVRFTLRPARAEGFSAGTLYAQFEERGNQVVELPMPWHDCEGVCDLFSCTLEVGDEVGLIWYHFSLDGLDGRRWESGVEQLTVYDAADPAPAWFGAGMTYHIFPDRFCRSRVPDPVGLVGGRTVHQSWEEEPEYRPDANGEIRNRDFFGGDLAGVLKKLPYLQSLGVETLYFCPVFEGAENHRYGTADYERVDPMLGTNEDFSALCAAAHARGMRVILDGVFNHTGFVSRYFNGDGFYPAPGAAQAAPSPYDNWFHFSRWPDRYDAWWGIYSLPAVRESEPSYVDYIARGKDSIARIWLRRGADGWRLDVADELPDPFIYALHAAAREEKADAVVIGEVWEDGSNKIAYGVRRKHILGGHCDGLMNYPLRGALIAYLLGGDAARFRDEMETLREHYPRGAFYSAMNSLGTHDTPRILTVLGGGGTGEGLTRDEKAARRLSPEERVLGIKRLKLAALVLFAFPGSPTVYYGDEAGMEGYEDPFNRRTYPWGREEAELVRWFAWLGETRKSSPALRRGEITYLAAEGPLLAFTRSVEGETVLAAVNAGTEPARLTLPGEGGELALAPLEGRLITLETQGMQP